VFAAAGDGWLEEFVRFGDAGRAVDVLAETKRALNAG